MGNQRNGVSRFGGGASGGGRRWNSLLIAFIVSEIRTILIVILRVKMGRGY